MRKKIFAGNWKMHHGPRSSLGFVKDFLSLVSIDDGRQWVLFPPYISIPALSEALKGSDVVIGGQNCHYEQQGAFTGEISIPMLKETGCTLCLVGHSERRQLFGETDEQCAKKVKALQDAGLVPMLCVGETQAERDQNQTESVIKKQLTIGFGQSSTGPIVIAYEPVWAIGTGKVATPEMAQQAHGFIRKVLKELCGDRGDTIQILYGGSVKPENAQELIKQPDIDGFLVGGASLDPKSFAKIGQVQL